VRRQRVRKGIIFISFLLFPVTIYYLSPVLIIMAAQQGGISGSFLMFGLMFLASLFLGRAFCGWVCPAGGLQECCFPVRDKTARGGRANWIKYFIWIPWIVAIAIVAVSAGGFHRVDPFYQTRYGISISEPGAYIVYFFFVGLIVILSLIAGKRAFCHYICWMAPFMVIGTKVRSLLKWPALRLKSDKEKCVDCKTCTKNCPMSLDVNGMVRGDSMKHSECILCGTCVDVCPKDVIRYSFSSGK
jgi:ferredoxin-type protein NapH